MSNLTLSEARVKALEPNVRSEFEAEPRQVRPCAHSSRSIRVPVHRNFKGGSQGPGTSAHNW